MINYITEHYSELHGRIISSDCLKLDWVKHFNEPFGVIGNFPYNISSQILFKVLESRAFVPEMVGMFQREVAERVVSGKDSKVYGVISVLIQAYYDTELLFHVKPGSFNPPPKVQSSVIRLVRKPLQSLLVVMKSYLIR